MQATAPVQGHIPVLGFAGAAAVQLARRAAAHMAAQAMLADVANAFPPYEPSDLRRLRLIVVTDNAPELRCVGPRQTNRSYQAVAGAVRPV